MVAGAFNLCIILRFLLSSCGWLLSSGFRCGNSRNSTNNGLHQATLCCASPLCWELHFLCGMVRIGPAVVELRLFEWCWPLWGFSSKVCCSFEFRVPNSSNDSSWSSSLSDASTVVRRLNLKFEFDCQSVRSPSYCSSLRLYIKVVCPWLSFSYSVPVQVYCISSGLRNIKIILC